MQSMYIFMLLLVINVSQYLNAVKFNFFSCTSIHFAGGLFHLSEDYMITLQLSKIICFFLSLITYVYQPRIPTMANKNYVLYCIIHLAAQTSWDVRKIRCFNGCFNVHSFLTVFKGKQKTSLEFYTYYSFMFMFSVCVNLP